ncbi:hypothetical protein ZHAS_00010517 [Anopheles sinensis]|uniref:Uncharacterized protein n=1 Tax=Anopheles sinensis TaxID=74873 RepID=A0A084VXS7_ANOSI|nr:hypothetical protein ZHAS_00010517 [Anopheles sinensis]
MVKESGSACCRISWIVSEWAISNGRSTGWEGQSIEQAAKRIGDRNRRSTSFGRMTVEINRRNSMKSDDPRIGPIFTGKQGASLGCNFCRQRFQENGKAR